MSTCQRCGYNNSVQARMCGQCGAPLGAAPPPFAVPGRGVQMGGAAATVPEGGPGAPMPPSRPGAAPPTVSEGSGPGAPFGYGGAPAGRAGRTVLAEEVARPLAGWLVVMRGTRARRYHDIPIYIGKNVIGRNPAHGRQMLDDQNASADHAMLIGSAEGVQITDLGSSNGTVVNSQRIGGTALLRKGDQVRLGKTTLVFVPMPAER